MSSDPEPAPALIGQRLGRYLVVGRLGIGGMGEVYRARDEQLGRDVALKLLPADVAADRDRLARFDREGRALAALNHPHIGAIYGLEEGQVQRTGPGGSAESVRALVLELVPGDTLADRLARGPLPVATAIAYACQIADALDAAHEGGIVHRDLKPANIAITPDDVVKVLDFGLAKTTSPDLAEPSQALTLAGTRPGLVLGTAAYMSPEQARGLAVDKRTDIWAFGCVLYEMLTGRRAFHGATVTDILAAILERDPDWNALPATTPPHVHALLARCLEKNVKQRLRDIGDARQELTAGKSPAVAARRGVGPSTIAVTCAVAAVAGVLGFALRAGTDSGTSAPVAPLRVLRITHGPDSEFAPAISPDRKWVAYLRSTAPPNGRTDIWVKFLAGGDPINLTASADLDLSVSTAIGGLDIAPEGNRIAVMAKTRGVAGPYATWEVPAPLPGVPRKLLDDGMLGARWSPNGKQLVFIRAGASAGDGLWIADADGADKREIVSASGGIHLHWPTIGADGHVYFIRTRSTIANLDQSDIYRIKQNGEAMEPVAVSTRRSMFPTVTPDARGLFYAGDQASAELALYWRPLPQGPATMLTRGVGNYAEPRLSADGRALVATYYELRQSIERIGIGSSSASSQALSDGYQGDLDPSVAPTGDRMVFSSTRGGTRAIWSAQLDGSKLRQLTSGDALDQWPTISPDGRQVAFISDRGGRRGIWLIPADGGAPRSLLQVDVAGAPSWSPDSNRLVYSASTGQWPGLWTLSVSNGRTQPLPTAGVATDPAWSPTGDVIAYLAPVTTGAVFTNLAIVNAQGAPVFPNMPPPPRVPAGFSNGLVAWSPDGKRLAVAAQNTNASVSIWVIEPASPHPEFTKAIEFPPAPRVRGLTWSPDGSAIIIGKHDSTSDIVLIDLGNESPH